MALNFNDQLRNSFGSYLLAANKGWDYIAFHQEKIVPKLEAVERGEIDRLMIWMPPRHGKTSITTLNFVPWYLGRNPTRSVLLTSYNYELAKDFGSRIKKQMRGDFYKTLFPKSRVDPAIFARNYLRTISDGAFTAVGADGAMSGKGVNLCVVAGTRVITDCGEMTIEAIHKSKERPRVLSFDQHRDALVWRHILATRESFSNALVKIRSRDDRQLICTKDHQVYCSQTGYREASLLEPGDALLCVKIPEHTTDTVAVVYDLRTERVPVYDIQVEGTNNFFANGILVHNCILDDFIKNHQEAESEARQEFLMQLYETTIKTRLEPPSAIIIAMTRWAIRDFPGRVLEKEGRKENGGDWEILCLPAQNEDGTYLWPERFKDAYEGQKRDEEGWNSLYQQDPQSSANYWFRDEWLQFYDIPITPGKFNAYMFVDPAASKNKKSDRTVIVVFAAGPERRLFLVDMIWDRLDPGERSEAIIRLARRWGIRQLIYEAVGASCDDYYLKKEMAARGFHVFPIPVGRDGPRSNMSKELRIKGLIPFFREGAMWFPRKMVRRLSNGKEVDLIQQFITDEYQRYKGEGTVRNDDALDCMSRILDTDKVTITYAEHEQEKRPMISSLPRGVSWEGIY